MQEAFLHFLWKFRIYKSQQLFTTAGEPIQVLNKGIHNYDAGPDFIHARIQIGDKIWAGHVEIHLKTSDWDAHKHTKDDAYKNVILHVVYEHDKLNSTAANIPTLVLKDLIPGNAINLYNNFLENSFWIPCAGEITNADDFVRNMWLDRMLIDRLETKSYLIQKVLQQQNNNWEQTAYIWLARNFGFKVNATAFEELAQRTPFLLFAKQNNRLQAEALLFGQAGMLQNTETTEHDEYYKALVKEYQYLSKKYNLTPQPKECWKFMRMHAGNFPTLRIAQFAALVHKNTHLLSGVLNISTLPQAEAFFMAETTDYWRNHILFGKTTSKRQSGKLGKESLYNLLINFVAPLQFCYGELRNKQELKEQAQHLLYILPPENNKITRNWIKLGFNNNNAADSQALIQLKNHYCEHKKCLACAIGTSILKNSSK